MATLRPGCMAQPTSEGKCNKPATNIGHGIYLCTPCQDMILRDLQILKRKAAEADRQMRQVAEEAAGWTSPPEVKQIPMRGEPVSGGLPSLGKDQ